MKIHFILCNIMVFIGCLRCHALCILVSNCSAQTWRLAALRQKRSSNLHRPRRTLSQIMTVHIVIVWLTALCFQRMWRQSCRIRFNHTTTVPELVSLWRTTIQLVIRFRWQCPGASNIMINGVTPLLRIEQEIWQRISFNGQRCKILAAILQQCVHIEMLQGLCING